MTNAENSKPKKQNKLNLALNGRDRERLLELQRLANTDSLVEVVRRSMAVYETILEHTMHGGEVIFKSPDGGVETVRIVV